MDIEILNEERLRDWCGRIELPEGAVDALAGMAREVREDPALEKVFTEFHQATAVRGEWHRSWSPLPFDPAVQAVLGERTALFYLLAYLAALPYAEREYARRGIGMEIFKATMLDIRTWVIHLHDLDGVWSFDQFSWIWRHLSCELFRLGRMQFMLAPFEGGVRAFRRKVDRRIVLLAGSDMLLRADGYALGAGRAQPGEPFYRPGPPPDDSCWQPQWSETADRWVGNPVSPYGYVFKDTAALLKSEWDLALQPGDTVLDMHIPRRDPFRVEDCCESLRRAFDFFAGQAPDRPFRAGFCHTWFFTPQLQRLLPPASNIVRFQREFYLYPFPGSPAFLWEYVFNKKVKDLASAPRDTSLRRAVLDWLEQGGELFDLAGVMFHGPEEWGSQPYMRTWDESLPNP